MHRSALDVYRCPATGERLDAPEIRISDGDHIDDATLMSASGRSFSVSDGVVDFVSGSDLQDPDWAARTAYDAQAGLIYRNAMAWLWKAFYQDEMKVRSDVIDQLDIQAGHRVLEIGCGLGDDSALILARMRGGELYLQDISGNMMRECRSRLQQLDSGTTQIEYSLSAASPLPFRDGAFDRVFHFGGLNMFSDIGGALREMARVTVPGGKVVVGDESMAPWLRETEFGRLVINNNNLYASALPIDKLPTCARNVTVRYIVANTFYLISFDVGDGPPVADYDLPHQGKRGGTMRTRYYGRLEGVTPEARRLAEDAASASGKSMHEWLDQAVRAAAEKDLP